MQNDVDPILGRSTPELHRQQDGIENKPEPKERPILGHAPIDEILAKANELAQKKDLDDQDLNDDSFMLRFFLVQAARLPPQHGYRYAKELLDISRGRKPNEGAQDDDLDEDLPDEITSRL